MCNLLIEYIPMSLSNNLLDNLPFFLKGFDPGLSAHHIN